MVGCGKLHVQRHGRSFDIYPNSFEGFLALADKLVKQKQTALILNAFSPFQIFPLCCFVIWWHNSDRLALPEFAISEVTSASFSARFFSQDEHKFPEWV